MSWNGVFMAEVQKHECLYNKFCREYRNRELRNECWAKVAGKFDMSPMDAEKKFRNIRTAYGRFLKKRRTTPAKGVDFIPFAFENCEWLALHIVHRNDETIPKCVTSQVDSDDENCPVSMSNIDFMNFSNGDYNDISPPLLQTNDPVHKDSSENNSNETTDESQDVEIVYLNSANTTPTAEKVTQDSSKLEISNVHNNISNDIERTEVDLSSTSPSFITTDVVSEATTLSSAAGAIPQYHKRKRVEIEDEDDLYCRSLVPRLKRLTPQARAYVRIQMEQLLFHAEYSGLTPQISTPANFQFIDQTVQTSRSSNGNAIEQHTLKRGTLTALQGTHKDI